MNDNQSLEIHLYPTETELLNCAQSWKIEHFKDDISRKGAKVHLHLPIGSHQNRNIREAVLEITDFSFFKSHQYPLPDVVELEHYSEPHPEGNRELQAVPEDSQEQSNEQESDS